jgi:hypothetical protein
MGYSRHKTRERQEKKFGIQSVISALCPRKCGFAHTRLEDPRGSTSFDSVVERVLDRIGVRTGYQRRSLCMCPIPEPQRWARRRRVTLLHGVKPSFKEKDF